MTTQPADVSVCDALALVQAHRRGDQQMVALAVAQLDNDGRRRLIAGLLSIAARLADDAEHGR